jgi:hypothetical protein
MDTKAGNQYPHLNIGINGKKIQACFLTGKAEMEKIDITVDRQYRPEYFYAVY